MICTTIQKKGYREICSLMPALEMAEIRLDRCNLSLEEIRGIFACEIPTVATCHVAEVEARLNVNYAVQSAYASISSSRSAVPSSYAIHRAAIAECREKLFEAIDAGAAYVDMEDDTPTAFLREVRKFAKENGTVLIVSHHDFSGTPSYEELKATVEECFHLGAGVAKVVTTAGSEEDCARVMKLYGEYFRCTDLLAFCMGETGRETRVECLRRGARFTYAFPDGSEPAAPGQWATSEIRKAVYGGLRFFGNPDYKFFMPEGVVFHPTARAKYGEDSGSRPDQFIPDAIMPASKSYAQRAIIGTALAEGVSRIYGYTPCFDSEAAIAIARSLGAKVSVSQSTITVHGIGAKAESLDMDCFNVGESGLLARLMIPLSAVLSKGGATIEGSGTLVGRQLKDAKKIMSRFGVSVSSEKVPLRVSGKFTGEEVKISGKEGSQLISGLLMACPLASGDSVIKVTDPKSIPYLLITIDVLHWLGVEVECRMKGGGNPIDDWGWVDDNIWRDCRELTFKIRGRQSYRAADIDLEGDWSASANFLVAGAVFGRTLLGGLDTTSLQADTFIMDVLISAGVNPIQLGGDSGPMLTRRFPLSGFETNLSDCPDLFPIAAILAAFCGGTSVIAGIDRLAHKESDRGAAIVEMLTQMGVQTSIEGNTLVVEGRTLDQRCLTGTLLKGGDYTSHHDHRMAMALKVASLGADSPIVIDDGDCVGKSFPEFNEIFTRLL